jgi:hypothetical protein
MEKTPSVPNNIAENVSLLSTVISTISIPKSGRFLYQTENKSEKF